MTTLLEEATLQFLNESQGLFDMMPMFGIDAGDIILQIKQSANALSELSKEPKWQKVCTVFIEKGEKDRLGGARHLVITLPKTCRLRIKPSPRQRPQKY